MKRLFLFLSDKKNTRKDISFFFRGWKGRTTTVRETTLQLTVIRTNVITIIEKSTEYHYLLFDKTRRISSLVTQLDVMY